MVFVRKVKTASGATAVQLAEYAGGRDRVIEHLGSAHTEAELAVLLDLAHAKLHEGQDELDLDWARPVSGAPVVQAQASQLLIHAIRSAWNRLGFNEIGDEAFFSLVLARLVEPTSKVDSLRVLTELGTVCVTPLGVF